jgi:hypothetical protein
VRREKWSTTTATHQQNVQHGGSANGSQEIQNPPIVGTVVRSRWTTWFGYFAVTILSFRRSPRRGFWFRRALEHPAHGRRAEMQARPRENASDLTRSHPRAEHPQPLYEVADELRKPVHRLAHLDERIRSLVIQSLGPRSNGQRRDEKASCGFGLRPTASRAEFQDRESFNRRVVRPALCRHAFHSRVFDAEFLEEQQDLALQVVGIGLESGARIELVLGATATGDERDVCHRNGVHDRGPNVAGPALG